MVPIVSLGIKSLYHELEEPSVASVSNVNPAVVQIIQFRLDESGAKLKSRVPYGGFGEDDGPRKFNFDGPFLLCLVERKSSNPYLAMWIANEEVLERTTADSSP